MDKLQNIPETLQTHFQSDLPTQIIKEQRRAYSEQSLSPSNNPFLSFLNLNKGWELLQKKKKKETNKFGQEALQVKVIVTQKRNGRLDKHSFYNAS